MRAIEQKRCGTCWLYDRHTPDCPEVTHPQNAEPVYNLRCANGRRFTCSCGTTRFDRISDSGYKCRGCGKVEVIQ